MTPLLPLDAARTRVLAAALPLEGGEEIELAGARGRVLAADVTARADVPGAAVSAMDGWAVRAGPAGRRVRIAGESRAGTPGTDTVGAEAAARISTGAALPPGAEAVVRLEDAEERDGTVLLGVAAAAGANVRAAGGDLHAGARVLAAGSVLGASELAAAIAAGAGTLRVAPRPRVAIIGTGDELRPPGAPLGPGQLHNSNGIALAALAASAGAEVVREATIRDDRAATEAGLREALGETDVLLISGGVSVGAHDHVRPALAALGVEEDFWRVALQPGKPTWFGRRGAQLVLGLPGNPVSTIVTAWLFALPALRALQGAPGLPERTTARLGGPVRRSPERTQAVRVSLAGDGNATLRATPTGSQESHLVSSLWKADGLAFIAPGTGEAAAEELVPVERWAL